MTPHLSHQETRAGGTCGRREALAGDFRDPRLVGGLLSNPPNCPRWATEEEPCVITL